MRKCLALIASLILGVSTLVANPVLTITNGNIDSIDILNSQGERVPGGESLEAGYMLHTNNSPIEAESPIGKIKLQPNSMIGITNAGENPTLYLIFGQTNLITDSMLTVYTPTTYTTIKGQGESVFISTDDEEKFFNFTDSDATSYNSITGKSYDVGTLESIDFMTNSSPILVGKEEYLSLTALNAFYRTPNAPIVNVDSELISPPVAPEVTINEEMAIEKTFSTASGDISIKAENGTISIIYPDTITENKMLNLLDFLSSENPTDLFSLVSSEENTIVISYPKDISNTDVEQIIDLMSDDISAFFDEQDATVPIEAYIPTPLVKAIDSSIGKIEITIEGNNAIIRYPDTIRFDEVISFIETEYPEDISSFSYELENAGQIRITYPGVYTKDEIAIYLDNFEDKLLSYIESQQATEVQAEPEKENAIVPVESTEASTSQIKSSISSSIPSEREFSFDLRLSTRAYTDSNKKQTLALSAMPEFSYGAFRLALNIDPFAIMDYENNENWLDWLGYSMNFIDTLQYRSMDEAFTLAIDKETNLYGDKLGLYNGVNHLWDKEYRPLTFYMGVDTTHFEMNIFSSDLTFGRFSDEDNRLKDRGTSGIDIAYRISEQFPVSFGVGLLLNTNYLEIDRSIMYPELNIYIPFYAKGYNNIGLSIGFASRLDANNIKYNPLDSGFILSATLPMEFYDFSASASVHYTNQGENNTTPTVMHYKGIDNPRYTPTVDSNVPLLTIAGNIGYNSSLFGIDLEILGDVNTNTMEFINENSLLEISTYLSISDVTLLAGISMQDFTNAGKYKEDASLYAGLDFDIGGVSTYLKAGIDNIEDKDFFLSYGATASFIGRNEDRLDTPVKVPFSFEITTGYEYHFEDKMSHYLIKPAITLGEGNYAFSLRAPILLKFNNSSFALGGPGGREWWDFGSDEESGRKVFYAVTDSMQMINYITIGNPDSSIAYINAQRDFLMNDTLFTAFGTDDALSLRAGFNFHNLSLELYGGDIESPHIGEFKLGIYPIDLEGFSIDISIPFEFYVEDRKNFDLFFYPETKINLPLFKNHFNIAAYAVGSISANYVDGEPINTNVIYDFENNRVFAALLGAEIGLKWPNFSITLQGGWRTGPLTPDMYNIFTSTYNQTPSITNYEDKSSFFAKATAEFDFKPFSLELAYSINDIVAMIDDYKSMSGDIFSAKARVNFNETISLYGAFHRKGFVSLFQKGINFKDDILYSSNTIYSIGMDFDYGVVSVNAEYSSSLNSDGFADTSKYLNVNRMYTDSKISSSFSVSTRIKF